MEKKITRPTVESLACDKPDCELYGEAGQGNLTERKTYGKDRIRYLRCGRCGSEFCERKGTALWNTKVREDKAVSVAEYLSEGCSPESTARLAKVDISVVNRLSRKVGQHGKLFHDERVQDVAVQALEADERHGFSQSKEEPAWEAEMMDPESKLILSHQQGRTAMPLWFPSFSAFRISRLDKEPKAACPTSASAFHEAWLTSRLSNAEKPNDSSRSRFALKPIMGAGDEGSLMFTERKPSSQNTETGTN
ncbi:MAG: IS1 family transposase [Caldilineaceae bacterium]|nr:IS1 family transposase [Caldilineaceae bacterium]